MNKYVHMRTKMGKIKTPMTFCWTLSKYYYAEVWRFSLDHMEDKILGFQFEPVFTKQKIPSYSDGSDQDEAGN